MIYIAAHKNGESKMGGYRLLQVGAALNPRFDADCWDDQGCDNISSKNPCYCELTALYWLWKNCKDEYIGICHYRRFFSKGLVGSLFQKKADLNYLQKKLRQSQSEIIVRKAIYSKQNRGAAIDAKEHCHSAALLLCMSMYYPEYLSAYEEYRNGHSMHGNNMLFSTKRVFDQYCQWLFSLLEKLENVPGGLDPYSKQRDAGYIAEHLLNVWLIHNHIKICEVEVTNLETSFIMKIGARFKDIVYRAYYH